MATASTVQISPQSRPAFSLPGLSDGVATKASSLLSENHAKWHIFFNSSGFHNHIAHHLCTLYALNAPPEILQRQYDMNKSYQRPAVPMHKDVVQDMHDTAVFRKHLGKEQYYHDYLHFFQDEMSAKGWQAVLQDYLFTGSEKSEDMLVRMYAGFYHPIIHLGFGVEFEQPAIMAEALAQAAVHDNWMKPLLQGAEKAAAQPSALKTKKDIASLLDDVKANPKLREAAASTASNRIRDGIMVHQLPAMIDIISQYSLRTADLGRATAEMTNACALFTGAAQRPTKAIKMDFYYMHCINASIFFSAFLAQSWLSTAAKVRLLEWKVRSDITMYASRGSPDLLVDEIVNYAPKCPSRDGEDPWTQIFDRVCRHEDDGHAVKLVRALAHGQKICEDYEDRDEFRVKHDMWLQLAHMTIDSVEAGDGISWVRSCGFDEAWKDVPDRTRAQL